MEMGEGEGGAADGERGGAEGEAMQQGGRVQKWQEPLAEPLEPWPAASRPSPLDTPPRGQDSLGNVILCRSAFESAPDAFALLRRPPDAIASHFCVSYGSALKMRRARPLAECQQLLRKSFGAFTAR
jgi:hypothetical protein